MHASEICVYTGMEEGTQQAIQIVENSLMDGAQETLNGGGLGDAVSTATESCTSALREAGIDIGSVAHGLQDVGDAAEGCCDGCCCNCKEGCWNCTKCCWNNCCDSD